MRALWPSGAPAWLLATRVPEGLYNSRIGSRVLAGSPGPAPGGDDVIVAGVGAAAAAEGVDQVRVEAAAEVVVDGQLLAGVVEQVLDAVADAAAVGAGSLVERQLVAGRGV